MTEIIFFDIDGTLRDEELGIPESVTKAFVQCRERGCKLVICTGRSMGTIQEDVLALGADGYITGGGTRIQYGNIVIKDTAFSSDKIRSALDGLIGRAHTGFTMESQETVFMNGYGARQLINRNQKIGKQERGEKIIYQDNIKSLKAGENRIHKICLWGYEEDYRFLESHLNDEIQLVQSFVWDKCQYYEVVPQGCHKGAAVWKLCDYLNIPLKHSMSFGDGKNDIEMLSVTGISVAMENGDRELFPYADLICREPMKDGIYLALVEAGVITDDETGK